MQPRQVSVLQVQRPAGAAARKGYLLAVRCITMGADKSRFDVQQLQLPSLRGELAVLPASTALCRQRQHGRVAAPELQESPAGIPNCKKRQQKFATADQLA